MGHAATLYSPGREIEPGRARAIGERKSRKTESKDIAGSGKVARIDEQTVCSPGRFESNEKIDQKQVTKLLNRHVLIKRPGHEGGMV